ncbi:MAG: NADH:flavin oxidoreductase/NADH oxidase [Bacteroidota bacterium]
MKRLFTPLRLRGMTLRNRIAVSPMQQYISTSTLATDWHMVHLGSRAVGGAGLIIAESSAVLPEGRATSFDTGLWNIEQMESWIPIVRFVQDQGAKIGIQLGHFGSKGSRTHPEDGFQSMPPSEGGWQTISSSAVPPMPGMPIPRELSIKEIHEIQDAFVLAAQKAIAAGFDTIEIHGAHGYLAHQFYSALINQRVDEYGGSFENRIRFLVETAQKIRRSLPSAMPLLVRISAVDFSDDPRAWNLTDSVALAKTLKEVGVDLITTSGGGFVYPDKSNIYPGYQVSFSERVRREAQIATGAVGMITTAQQAEEILVDEKADLIVMAREFLRNPYFALQAQRELGVEVDAPTPYKRGFTF